MTAAQPIPFFGVPHEVVPPLRMSIRPVVTPTGTRYQVCAQDEKGAWQPWRDAKLGRAINYFNHDMAMRAYKRWKVKVDRQGVVVCFVEGI